MTTQTQADLNLGPADIERLGQALITLTKELWILKDRQRILEAALAEAGIVTREAIDAWQPDDALRDELGGERRRLIDGIIDVLTTDRGQSDGPDPRL